MEFFYLGDKQSAVIRILSTSVDKIERGGIHSITCSNGEKKRVRCLGKNCPLCAAGNQASERLFVHLWDYTDNTEKIWNRTANTKFLNSLKAVEADWGPINEAVIRITRDGEQFPKYDVSAINPKQYADVDNDLIDKEVAWMCSTYRSADELDEFLKTGVLPPHVKKKKEDSKQYVSKEEWQKQQNSAVNNIEENKTSIKEDTTAESVNFGSILIDADDDFDDLPF